MTTLTAGSTANFSLSGRQVLTLTADNNTTGTIKRTQYVESSSSKTDTLGPPATNRTYGPFGHETDIELTCTYGSFEYDVTGTSLVTAGTDPVTGGSTIFAAGRKLTVADFDPSIVAYAGREFRSVDAVVTANNGTAATVTIDAASPFGVPAAKIAAPAGNVWAELGVGTLNVPDFAENGHRIVWLVWVEDCTKVAKIWTYSGTAGYGRYMQTNDYYINDSIEFLHNGGHCVVAHPGNANANTLIAGDDVTDAKIRVWATSGQAFNVWVLGVYVPTKPKPFLTFTFDDNSVSFKKFAEILERYGFRGTFGLNTQNVGTNDSVYVNWSDVDALIASGHQVVSHNVANSKYITSQTLAQYMTDYRATRNALIGRGYPRSGVQQYHPYVQGGHDPALIAAMQSEGVNIARTTKSAHCELFGRAMCPHIIPSREYTNTVSLAQMTSWMDDAETYGQDVFAMGHMLNDTTPGAVTWITSDFEAHCADVAARISAGRFAGAGTVADWSRLRGVD